MSSLASVYFPRTGVRNHYLTQYVQATCVVGILWFVCIIRPVSFEMLSWIYFDHVRAWYSFLSTGWCNCRHACVGLSRLQSCNGEVSCPRERVLQTGRKKCMLQHTITKRPLFLFLHPPVRMPLNSTSSLFMSSATLYQLQGSPVYSQLRPLAAFTLRKQL